MPAALSMSGSETRRLNCSALSPKSSKVTLVPACRPADGLGALLQDAITCLGRN
jgi:hypothetical protein